MTACVRVTWKHSTDILTQKYLERFYEVAINKGDRVSQLVCLNICTGLHFDTRLLLLCSVHCIIS